MLQENHSINAAGHLTVAGVDTVSLAGKYGTPLYVMDEARLRENMRRYANILSLYFPEGSMPLMASKALSCREIYRIANSEGIGADVVSAGELYTALSAGFPADKIYFHGSAKTMEEIRMGVEAGIRCFVVDNFEELSRISRVAGERGVSQRILIRVTPGIDPHTFAAVDTGRVDSKFGVAIETGQAFALTKLALETPHVTLEGFHCHIGSQIFEAEPFLMAVDIMTQYIRDIRDRLGFTASVLNLGGGIAIPYVYRDPKIDLDGYIHAISEHLAERCRALDLPMPVVLMEPGRSIVADAGITLYTVQNIKTIPGYKEYVAVDGGMTDNPRYALYGAEHTAIVANKAGLPADQIVTIAGRCCESDALIGENMSLQRAEVDDIIAVLVTGAYNYSMASNYNRVPRPPIVMLRDGQDRIVVRRETLADVISCDL